MSLLLQGFCTKTKLVSFSFFNRSIDPVLKSWQGMLIRICWQLVATMHFLPEINVKEHVHHSHEDIRGLEENSSKDLISLIQMFNQEFNLK